MLLYYYGLLGKALKDTFLQIYFREKFKKEELLNHSYTLFELENIIDFPTFLKRNSPLEGLNIASPYKQAISPYLDRLDKIASLIGAVDVVKIELDGTLTGYNTDYFCFYSSLEKILRNKKPNALILGTGEESKTVQMILENMGILYRFVSQNPVRHQLSYEEVDEITLKNHHLIINTIPLAMFPNKEKLPELPYHALTNSHMLYDCNPENTTFLKQGKQYKAKIKNGLKMRRLQADKAWEIWVGEKS